MLIEGPLLGVNREFGIISDDAPVDSIQIII